MLLNTDYFYPNEVTGYVREAMLNWPVNRFQLAQWLPNRNIDDLVYRVTRGGDGLIDAATFRSFDAESSIGSRPGVTRITGELPPISRKLPLGEYDRLRQRANPSEPIRMAIISDAERVARQVAARLELARGDALVNGSVTINEGGLQVVADYGRPSGNAVTAGTLWSTTASADPISDLQTWTQYYVDTNGVPPGALVVSTAVRGYLMRNAAIRAIAATVSGTPTIVSPEKIQEILNAYDLPPLFVYDARVKVNGTATRIVPQNIALLLPPPVAPDDFEGTQMGATFWGTTAESLDPSYGLEAGTEAGIVAGVYREEDPIAVWTKAAAIGLPVLANPAMSMAATVS